MIEALGAKVADEGKEVCLAAAEGDEVSAGGGDQSAADAEAPAIGIDIESGELAVMGKVGLARGGGSGEPHDDVAAVAVDGDDGVRVEGIEIREIVFGGAVFGAELVKVVVG